jgi:hypothetical protein
MICDNCKSEVALDSQFCSNCGHSIVSTDSKVKPKMNKSLIIFLGVVLVTIPMVFAGLYMYRTQQDKKLIATFNPSIKNSSLRLKNELGYMFGDSQITYREFFENLEKDISEINNNLICIQSASTPRVKEKTEKLIEYLKASQETLRCMLNNSRKRLAKESAVESAKESQRYFDNLGYLGQYYARTAANESRERISKADREVKESAEEFVSSLKKLKSAREAVVNIVPPDCLLEFGILNNVIEKTDIKNDRL